jgi:hypothetical protein
LSSKSGSSSASLAAGSFPFSNFFRRRLSSSSSSSLHPRFNGGGLLDAIPSFSWWPKICSGESRRGRRSEEKDDKLMEEAGEKAGEGDWTRELYWQDAEPSGASAPPTTPLLTVRATRLRIGLRLGREATRRLSPRREGEGAGQWCRAHLSTAAAKLRRLFNLNLLFYYDMVKAPSSTFNPRARRLLQV